MKTRDEALALLHEYTESESLRKHALGVEAAMRWYASHFDQPAEEQEKWGITGLLHDFDYEKYPDEHPSKGNTILKELNYPDDVCAAIMGHADFTGVPRTTLMAKTLFAVDELSGLITAAVLVRPDKDLRQLKLKSLKKKFKDKAFAKGCNRDDIRNGAEELGIELEQHMQNVIDGMIPAADELGLSGS